LDFPIKNKYPKMANYEGFYKIKCECGFEGVAFQFGGFLECPHCGANSKIQELSTEDWTTDEICDAWASTLEDDNYHEWTELPYAICDTLRTYITDDDLIKQIMIDMYNNGLQ
jgi:hypothetical protein